MLLSSGMSHFIANVWLKEAFGPLFCWYKDIGRLPPGWLGLKRVKCSHKVVSGQ